MTAPWLDIDRVVRETFVARVEHYATLDSTNTRARAASAEGSRRLPLLIVADAQTAGRGRGTNRWWTGENNLAFSLLLDADEQAVPRSGYPLVGLAAAVATARTVAPALLGTCELGIHWPNDLFAGGRKLAGILVEVLARRQLVVGVGLNVNSTLAQAPEALREKVTTLRELTGAPHNRGGLLVGWLLQFAQWVDRLAVEPEEVAATADSLCLQRGMPLTARIGKRPVSGRCAGIGPDGALLLDTPGGREKVYSGLVG